MRGAHTGASTRGTTARRRFLYIACKSTAVSGNRCGTAGVQWGTHMEAATEQAVVLWPLLLFTAGAIGLILAMLGISAVLGGRHSSRLGNQPYESGIKPTGSARMAAVAMDDPLTAPKPALAPRVAKACEPRRPENMVWAEL